MNPFVSWFAGLPSLAFVNRCTIALLSICGGGPEVKRCQLGGASLRAMSEQDASSHRPSFRPPPARDPIPQARTQAGCRRAFLPAALDKMASRPGGSGQGPRQRGREWGESRLAGSGGRSSGRVYGSADGRDREAQRRGPSHRTASESRCVRGPERSTGLGRSWETVEGRSRRAHLPSCYPDTHHRSLTRIHPSTTMPAKRPPPKSMS